MQIWNSQRIKNRKELWISKHKLGLDEKYPNKFIKNFKYRLETKNILACHPERLEK